MQISVKSHGNIINALIGVLQVKRFNIPSDTVFAIQSVLKKRDVSFLMLGVISARRYRIFLITNLQLSEVRHVEKEVPRGKKS